MPVDDRESKAESEARQEVVADGNGTALGSIGKQAMQGRSELSAADTAAAPAAPNPAQKGSDFEQWAATGVFSGDARRLVIQPEDNEHLDKLGDAVGITKSRRISDAYVDADGSVWELKAGYGTGGINQDQLYEYSLMEEAGYVRIRDGDKLVDIPITSVNYLFDTKAGALANAHSLRGRATPWYRDEEGNVQLLEE